MIARALLPLLLAACTLSGRDPRIEATFSHDSDALTKTGRIPYLPPGVFTVTGTATIEGGDVSIMSRSAIRATLTIALPKVIPASVTTATMTLLPTGTPGSFTGAAALAWPDGGDVPIHAVLEGVSQDFTVPVDVPMLAMASSPGSASGSTATVPVCVESSTISGGVAIHLESATLAGATTTDTSLTLTSGGCDPALTTITTSMPNSATFDVRSHAPFTVSTSMPAFKVSAVMPSTTTGAPPLAMFPLSPISAAPVQQPPIQVRFTSPASGSAAAAGSVVTLAVKATTGTGADASRVAVAFQSSPEIAIVPATVTTNGSGVATAAFAMPDLAGGSLVIAAVGGSSGDTISLHN